MNLIIERPWALYGILFLVPVIIYSVVVFKRTAAALSASYEKNSSVNFKNIKIRIVIRILLRSAAWCMMIFAYAGISWGTVSSPMQKNGNAIAFVFDISYSMTANDAPGGLSRLEASSTYARTLLDYVGGASISAVIAKGSGVIAVPLTDDTQAVYTLLNSLSPTMISSAGTNLGEGVLTALKSFPHSVSKAPVIWLFTDGEETGNNLLSALNTALRQGVSVVIIGFGNRQESEIVAGDGSTVVKTALRADKIKEIVDLANKKNFGEQGFKFFKGASAKFVDASQSASAFEILSTVSRDFSAQGAAEQLQEVSLAYEVRLVERHRLFILLALVLFVLSFIASEFSPRSLKETLAVALIALSFTSCSSSFNESKKILQGAWNWYQKDYNSAIADFSQSLSSAQENGDELIKQYALYGLSATYLMQNENMASLEKINSLSSDVPEKIRFAAFYNSGIIAQREGEYEKAAELFKQALLVDGTNVNAKINLEVSQNQRIQRAKEAEKNMEGANEKDSADSLLEESVFNRIRENEQRQWKNLQTQSQSTSALDY